MPLAYAYSMSETQARPQPGPSGPVLFLRCPTCFRHPVHILEARQGSLTLSCPHCGRQSTRADRRSGTDRRQTLTIPRQERRQHERRGRLEELPIAGIAAIGNTPVVMTAARTSDTTEDAASWPVGISLQIRGEVFAAADLTIEGHVRGSISVPDHALVVAASASVVANLAARDVVVRGAVLGHITAKRRITIEETARVRGDLTSAVLTIAEGADFTGRVERREQP